MLEKVKNWWEEPFSTNMDGVRWICFLGFVLIVCAAWRSVINLMQEIAQ